MKNIVFQEAQTHIRKVLKLLSIEHRQSVIIIHFLRHPSCYCMRDRVVPQRADLDSLLI